MKLTDEERQELKELYETYKDCTDLESLKLLAGLIKTSQWYKNNKITYECVWNGPCRVSTIRYIFDNVAYKVYNCGKMRFYILLFLKYLINIKYPKICKPI